MKTLQEKAKDVWMEVQRENPNNKDYADCYLLPSDWQIEAMIRFYKHKDIPYVFERYYKNHNEWCEISSNLNRHLNKGHDHFSFVRKGYGYSKINGIEYRAKL